MPGVKILLLVALIPLALGCEGKSDNANGKVQSEKSKTIEQAKEDPAVAKITALKRIGVACHLFHETNTHFPIPPGSGGLSWRVHILPYLGEKDLYEQFKLDEAWDSEHNKPLAEKMPDVFKLAGTTVPGNTQFVVPRGEGFLFDGERSRRMRDLTDGPVNTVMVVVVNPEFAVPWTKREDPIFDPARASEILENDAGGYLALMAHAGVHKIDASASPEKLKEFFTIAGGEFIDESLLSDDLAAGPQVPEETRTNGSDHDEKKTVEILPD